MKILNHRLHQDDGTPFPFERSPNQGGEVEHDRQGPGTEFATLLGSLLRLGTRVETLKAQERRRFVVVPGGAGEAMDLQGWEHGGFLRRVGGEDSWWLERAGLRPGSRDRSLRKPCRGRLVLPSGSCSRQPLAEPEVDQRLGRNTLCGGVGR